MRSPIQGWAWVPLCCAASAAVAVGCSRDATPVVAALERRPPAAMVSTLDRSRWVPTGPARLLGARESPDGTLRGFVGRMRYERTPSGAVRRATQLLPQSLSSVDVLPVPPRLGGGYVFVATSTGTELLHAATFLGPMRSIARSRTRAVSITPGTDSLLVLEPRDGRVQSIALDTGEPKRSRALPDLPGVSGVAFADASRGLVFGDLVGGMLTVDAGATWARVEVPDAALGGITVDGPDFVVGSSVGRFRVAPDGSVAEERDPPAERRRTLAKRAPASLERLVLHGWPLGDGTALLLDEDGLSRHRLDDGDLVARSRVEIGTGGPCTALRAGPDVGFACARGSGTTLYLFDPPLGIRALWTLPPGAAVVPQPSGALVVDATCAGRAAPGAHCVLFPDGTRREIAASGDVGRERVVALSGARAAVVVPPLGEVKGRLTLVGPGGETTTRPLELAEDTLVAAGTWLTAFSQAGDDLITGWVQAPSALQGIAIEPSTGRVTALGSPRSEPTIAVVGREALVLDPAKMVFHETTDGGATWGRVEPPDVGATGGTSTRPTLRCGALGCVADAESGTWTRIGWGPPADTEELDEPERSTPLDRPSPPRPLATLRCSAPSAPTPRRGGAEPTPRAPISPLPSFFAVPGPPVPKGWTFTFERAVGAGPAVLYGLAPKGATGERGRLLARLRLPFGGSRGLIASTALTVAPFRDEADFNEYFGISGASLVLHAVADPRGDTAVLSLCRASREGCDLVLARDGQPVTPLRVTDDAEQPRVMSPGSTLIVAGDKLYLGTTLASQVQVRVFDERGSRLAFTGPRSIMSPFLPEMTATRDGRAGLLLRGVGTGTTESWFVVGLDDPDRRPVRLFAPSLSGVPLRPCTATDDGWLVHARSTGLPVVSSAGRLVDVGLLLRALPGSACIEAASARLLPGIVPQRAAPDLGARESFPMTVVLPGDAASVTARCVVQ